MLETAPQQGAPVGVAPQPAPMPGMPMPTWMPNIPGKAASIAGMVLGIVALPFTCLAMMHWALWILGVAIGVVGIVLSAIGYTKSKQMGLKGGMAIAGFVCSFVAVLTYFIIAVVGVYLGVIAATAYSMYW